MGRPAIVLLCRCFAPPAFTCVKRVLTRTKGAVPFRETLIRRTTEAFASKYEEAHVRRPFITDGRTFYPPHFKFYPPIQTNGTIRVVFYFLRNSHEEPKVFYTDSMVPWNYVLRNTTNICFPIPMFLKQVQE